MLPIAFLVIFKATVVNLMKMTLESSVLLHLAGFMLRISLLLLLIVLVCQSVLHAEILSIERVNITSNGNQANGNSEGITYYSSMPSISSNGRYVVFASTHFNLVEGDTNGKYDIFVHDREKKTTKRISISKNGDQANGWSNFPRISSDGRYVTFSSDAANLVDGDTNGTRDVFITPVNDAPTASTQSLATNEDTAKSITLSASDAEGDTLTYTVVSQPSKGALSGTVPNLTYTPNANYSDSDSFTFKANDGTADSNTAMVSITVNSVNDARKSL